MSGLEKEGQQGTSGEAATVGESWTTPRWPILTAATMTSETRPEYETTIYTCD